MYKFLIVLTKEQNQIELFNWWTEMHFNLKAHNHKNYSTCFKLFGVFPYRKIQDIEKDMTFY